LLFEPPPLSFSTIVVVVFTATAECCCCFFSSCPQTTALKGMLIIVDCGWFSFSFYISNCTLVSRLYSTVIVMDYAWDKKACKSDCCWSQSLSPCRVFITDLSFLPFWLSSLYRSNGSHQLLTILLLFSPQISFLSRE
jgi:hypothetical protein